MKVYPHLWFNAGVYWQVTPTILLRRIADPDRAKVSRVMQAMYRMKKIIIADVERAYRGEYDSQKRREAPDAPYASDEREAIAAPLPRLKQPGSRNAWQR